MVTHDREEAFELADRVAVLVDGQIQQHSLPAEVYERPANLTVARFMGANLLSARVRGDGSVELDDGVIVRLPGAPGPGQVYLAIVPEQARVVENRTGLENVLPAQLIRSQYRGGEYRLRVKLGDSQTGQIIEARAKDAPSAKRLLVHLPEEAIHVIQNHSSSDSAAPISRPAASIELTKLQEEIV
jgi:ABC-type Fe3+/spermidine/putrescine transport system ATPase subunit